VFSGIENYYEHLVFARIQAWLTEWGEGADLDVLEDVACVALNQLSPRYFRHSVDLAFHLSQSDRKALDKEVEKAVKYAFKVVCSRRADHNN